VDGKLTVRISQGEQIWKVLEIGGREIWIWISGTENEVCT